MWSTPLCHLVVSPVLFPIVEWKVCLFSKHGRFIGLSSDIWAQIKKKKKSAAKLFPIPSSAIQKIQELVTLSKLEFLKQCGGSKDQWEAGICTTFPWQAGSLSIHGSSKGTLLRKQWLTWGVITEKHSAEQPFMGRAEVVTCAAELAPVLGRRELYWCKQQLPSLCFGLWLATQAPAT